MTKKIKITKYDKTRAKGFFILFKALELFGVFVFFLGFHWLGSLFCKYFPNFFTNFWEPMCCGGYFEIWVVGLMTFIIGLLVLSITFGILYLIYQIFKSWVKANWNLAKKCSEDEKDKLKRLNKEKKDKEEFLKKLGFSIGDKVKIIGEGRVSECSSHRNTIAEVYDINYKGHLRIDFGSHKHWFYIKDVEKITKKSKVIK